MWNTSKLGFSSPLKPVKFFLLLGLGSTMLTFLFSLFYALVSVTGSYTRAVAFFLKKWVNSPGRGRVGTKNVQSPGTSPWNTSAVSFINQ